MKNIDTKISSMSDEIAHIQKAIDLMNQANDALKKGKSYHLKDLGFSPEHIKELENKFKISGEAFPHYTIKNNEQNIAFLQLVIEKLKLKYNKNLNNS